MRSAKPAASPSSSEKATGDEGELGIEEQRVYRGQAARCNYMSVDRPDLIYASKEASRQMSKPTIEDRWRMGKIGKYLRGYPRLVQKFPWQR